MTFLPIQLPPGIVRGANPDDSPGRWYDGSLIRWREGVMEPIGGWSRVTASPLASPVRRIHQWRRNNGEQMLLAGCDEHLYSNNSGSYTDVAPADLIPLDDALSGGGYGAGTYGSSTYGTPRTGETTLTPAPAAWSFSNWGEDVLAVASTDGRLLYFDSSSSAAEVVQVGVADIASAARASNVVTITTASAHGYTTGDLVSIDGIPVGSFDTPSASITVVTSTTFTYAQTGADFTWSLSNPLPSSLAAADVADEPAFSLAFTDNSYAISYDAKARNLSVPIANRAVIVTPERHAVMLQPGGERRRVAWSSREDYTDWNFSSTTNTAGFIDVQTETQLLTPVSVREGTLIWSENRAFLMRYVGQPFIYGIDELGSTSLFAPNAFAEFDGRCVWMDASGFMIYEGGSIRPLACPLADFVFSGIDKEYGPRVSHAAVNGTFNEVWFFYPSSGSAECDRYVLWNWAENHWSMGVLARTAASPAGVGKYPIMAGSDNHIYRHEDGWTYDGFDCANNVYVASGTINLPGDERSININQLLPSNGANYSLTKYTLFTRMTPGGAERTFGPYYARSDGYVDTRATGRDMRIRICANAAGDWSIGRIRLQVSAGGRR